MNVLVGDSVKKTNIRSFIPILYSSKKMSDGVGEVYSGAAEFGKFSAIISGIIGTFIALILAGIGIWILIDATGTTQSVEGTIIDLKCSNTTSDQDRICTITVSYPTNKSSVRCSRNFSVIERPAYEKGKKVTIYYNPSDPCSTGGLESKETQSILGITLVGGSLIIITIVWLTVWLTQKYKFTAAAEGVYTAIQLI